MIAELTENNQIENITGIVEGLLDPVHFCESLLTFQGQPLRLYDYQAQILREIDLLSDHAAIQKARQVGLSFALACGIVYAAFANADARFLIVSRTWEQSGFIFAHVRDFFSSSPILDKSVDWKRTTKQDLCLKNGTIIYHRTGGHRSRNIRGFSLSNRGALIFDESSYLDDATITNLLPIAQGCGVIHCSTPGNPVGSFWRACQQGSGYKHYRIPMSRCPRFSKLDIDKLRKTMSPSDYAREVLGDFAQGQAAVYDSASIERNTDHSRPGFDPAQKLKNATGHNHIAAVDVSALQGDPIVLIIGDYDHANNFMEVVGLHVWAGTHKEKGGIEAEFTDDPDYVAASIAAYCREFNVVKLYVDNTENDYFARTLLRRYMLPVETITWGNDRVKQRIVEHCSTCLRADRVSLCSDLELTRQLLTYSYDLKKNADSGEERTIYLKSIDDRHDALAMLCQQITDEAYSWSDFIEVW